MKKLFFASLWVLACLTAACSDEKDEPNGESGSVVGEWVFQKNEYYRNGKMIDSFTAVEDEDKISRPKSIMTGLILMMKRRECW